MKCYIQGVSLSSPKFSDWEMAKDFFSDSTSQFNLADLEQVKVPKAELLTPTERRRATRTVNLALSVAHKAHQNASVELDACYKVFSCSHGDSDIFDYLCSELSEPEVILSPTKFHQSLHNSVAGYWDICTGSQLSSTSISAGEYSFISGFIEAVLLCNSYQKPVLYVSYDLNPPAKLHDWIKISEWMGVGMIITPDLTENTMATCELSIGPSNMKTSTMDNEELEQIRTSNPSAMALPLLQALAVLPSQKGQILYFDFPQEQQVKFELT